MERESIKLKTVIYLYCYVSVVVVTSAEMNENNSTKSRFQLPFRVVRTENDLKKFRDGAHIDFVYNETAAYPGHAVSSPGCPKSHEGRPWVYYGNPKKCYLVGFRGPCPLGKRIFFEPKSKHGVCNCDCFAEEIKNNVHLSPVPIVAATEIIDYAINEISQNLIFPQQTSYQGNSARRIHNPLAFLFRDNSEEKQQSGSIKSSRSRAILFNQKTDDNQLASSTKTRVARDATDASRNSNRYSFCFSNWYQRQVVYDNVRQECTPFLDQGPCKNGEWLVRNPDKENGVMCEKRKCHEINGMEPEDGGKFSYFDYKRQTCFTEVYGTLQISDYNLAGNIFSGSNVSFCRDAGMRYSRTLRTCVRTVGKDFQYKAIG